MNARRLALALLLLAAAATDAAAATHHGDDEAPATLDAEVERRIDAAVTSAPSAADVPAVALELFDAAIAVHGDLDLFDEHLMEASKGAADDAQRVAALRLAAHAAWRFGELDDARKRFGTLAEDEGDLAGRLSHARLLDATGRSEDALEAYGALVPLIDDSELETRLRLRMALMSMEIGGEEQKDALAEFAREDGVTSEVRNRCAIVLALLGRPGDAADLYEVTALAPEGAATDVRKKARKAAANGELRVAEWALRAKDFPRAQGAAWRAVHLAPVARERRYGLTLLAEAHRGDDTLGALLGRFDAERAGLPPEARRMWIDLLRETGATDEAIAMSQGDAAAEFTREERVRLLEMYREADREDEMVAVYGQWIAAEPAELLWREGLSRHHLEQGDRVAAVSLWEDWFDGFERSGATVEQPLVAAETLESLGLDALAQRAAASAIDADDGTEAAYLFLFELHLDRGRLDDARGALDSLDGYCDAGSPARMPLSDCLERIGELEAAVRVLEGVREARGSGKAGEDLEMRLAWLYSEVGREEMALELWQELWTRVKSLARRRFVEDRMMTVASRLGVLADIAVELERKLFDDTATERDSGLLVRLYTKVGDSVSAAEIVDEFLEISGGSQLEALTEKARVYLACNDYYLYEKAVAQLIEIDPEGKPDYYRQLAMSQLERGKPDQARATLMKLQELPGGDDTSAEFEAGVLSLSGMREEAIAAYRRGLAAHPERIDSYLLMANLMKQIRQSDRAVGMFQYLAETADRDDMFTIAIDGLLNMLVDAPPRPKMVQWARRITLERLAAKEDATYLYQLLADLAEETQDEEGHVRALENLLASAGPRRASVLRELMELSKPSQGSFNSPGRTGDRDQQLAFGRRLVGLAELVPPEVYLDLGDAFLDAGDEASAARTFDLTREFPDGDLYQQQAAERFEKAGFVERSLDLYQAVLAASPTNVPLLAKVGELRESLGGDGAALDLYMRAHDVLLARKTLFESGADEEDEDQPFYFARNVDDFDQYLERVLQGVLSTLADDAAVAAFLESHRAAFEAELPAALAAAEAGRASSAPKEGDEEGEAVARLERHPRLDARVGIVRRVAFASGQARIAEGLDRTVLAAFPEDDGFLDAALDDRAQWGRFSAGRSLVDASGAEGDRRASLLARLGDAGSGEDARGGVVSFDQALGAVLPAIADGRVDDVRDTVRRADRTGLEKESIARMGVLFAAALAADDDELALSVARDWVRLDLDSGTYPHQLESQVESLLSTLDAETGLALARFLVGRVLEDPEKNSQFVTILPKLTKRFGEGVVEAEQVRTLLDGYGDKYAFGLGPVLALLPPADRAGALRGVWSKLEATNRAAFLIDLVNDSNEETPEELGSFILESLPDALGEADDFVKYTASRLVEVEHSHELVAAMARQIVDVRPQLETMPAVALVHRHACGEEGLAPEAAGVWATLAADESNDYYKRQAREKLTEIFVESEIDAFVAALDERVAEDGESVSVTKARVELMLEGDRDEMAASTLQAALEENPEEEELLELRRRLQRERSERVAAALTLERILEVTKDDQAKKRHAKSLVAEWQRLRAPVRALAAQKKLDELGGLGDSGIPGFPAGFTLPPGAMISVNGVLYTAEDLASSKKGLPKSFDDVRESLAEGDEQEAARIFRRLWRQFPVGQPKPRPYYSRRRYRNLALANLTWPADEEGEGGAEDDEPKKGGLLSFDPEEPEPRPDPPNAYERIAIHERLLAEQWRFLRTVQSYELDRLQGLLEGLLGADIAAAGEEAALAELLQAAARGDGGRADQIRLLALLDRSPELVTGEAADALADLVRTIPPRDAVQVRRLARVLLRSGQDHIALRLYEWCALQGFDRSVYRGEESTDVVTYVTDRELVKEARDHLEGDAQLELIQIILDVSKPVDRPWERERYEELVFDTWDDIVGPVEALERARTLADEARDASKGLRRRAARRVVSLYLAAGERDHALQALEVGIAKLDPATVAQPDEAWYRTDPKSPGRLSTADLRRILPPGGGEIPESAEWFSTFATTLSGWLAEERIGADGAVQALALTAVRLGEVGREDEARALAREIAGRDDISPSTEHWVIDALRATGDGATADERERTLLGQGRLHPERIPDVVSRVLEAEGPEAALALATPIAEIQHHPRLMELLIQAADSAGDETAAAAWRETDAAARAAEQQLEE
ncbi:MAG: hypothetical protein AAF726_01765 [Planctomycetota bacterium]